MVPSSDGLTAQQYKKLKEEMLGQLVRTINEITQTKIAKDIEKRIYKFQLQRKGQSEETLAIQINFFTEYCYKLFTTIITEHLRKYISNTIYTNQTGYIPQRKMKDNL